MLTITMVGPASMGLILEEDKKRATDMWLGDGEAPYEKEWHVGEGKALPLELFDAAHRVIEVQADGDELEWIRRVLGVGEDIDTNQVRVVRFFGDQAKFIAANLR